MSDNKNGQSAIYIEDIKNKHFVYSRLKEFTYRIIKDKLLNLEIEPGSRIREDLLAEEMQVSRTPVREAIRQLVAEGFIEDIPRRGLFFVDFTPEVILDLLDVREALEKLAVCKCIDKINESQLEELERLFKRFEEAVEAEEYKECNVLDSMFHKKIVEITGNKKLIEFINVIEEFMQIIRNIEAMKNERKSIIALEDHRRILEAIRNRDKEMAKLAIKENINNMKRNIGLQDA